MKVTLLFRVIFFSFIFLLIQCNFKKITRKEPLVWYCGSTLKVLPQMVPSPYFKDVVHIKVLHNEHEPFQVVISAGEKPLKNVMVKISKLASKDSSINFPESNIRLYLEGLVQVTKLDPDKFGEEGYYPDPLPPLKLPFDVPSGENRVVWVDIEVGEEIPSGTYTGYITVTSNGKLLDEKRIEIEVVDLFLPPIRETHHYNFVGIDIREIKKVFPELKGEKFDQFLADIYKFLWERRIMPEKIALIRPERDNNTGKVFFGESQRRWGDYFFKELGFFATSVIVWEDSFAHLSYYSTKYNQAMITLLKEWAENFERFGWSKEHKNQFLLVEYIHDETTKYVDKAHNNLNEAKKLSSAAKLLLKKLCTIPFTPSLFGKVDIWCPRIHEIDLKFAMERKRAGELVWSYVSGYPLYPDGPNGMHITHPSVDNRIIFWFNYLWNLDGFLYWEGTLWTYKGNDPWQTANTFWTNGNGVLIYPGTYKYVGKDAPCPVSSIRLEMLREGIEDLELFLLAEKVVGRREVENLIKSVVKSINNYEGMASYKEPVKLYNVRTKLIETIIKNKNSAPGES